MNRAILAVPAAVLMFLTTGAAADKFVDEACPVPAALKADAPAYAAARQSYQSLQTQNNALDTQVTAHNDTCNAEPKGSPREIECGNQEASWLAKIEAQDGKVTAYQQGLANSVAAATTKLKQRQLTTRAALRQVGPNNQRWQTDMQDWLTLGEEARNEARQKAFSAGFDLIAEKLNKGLDDKIALNGENKARFTAWYGAYGRSLPDYARRQIADRVRNLKTGGDVLKLVTFMKEQGEQIHDVFKPMQEKDKGAEALGMAYVGLGKQALTLMSANPEAKATVTAVEVVFADVNGWAAYLFAREGITALADLQENQLARVKALAAMNVADVNALRDLKRAGDALRAGRCPQS